MVEKCYERREKKRKVSAIRAPPFCLEILSSETLISSPTFCFRVLKWSVISTTLINNSYILNKKKGKNK